MTEILTQSLYNGEVKIDFYPNSHQYKIDKKNKISVTAATGIVDKSQVLLRWAGRLTEAYLTDVIESGNQVRIKDIQKAVMQHAEKKEEAADLGTIVHQWAEDYAAGKNPKLPEDERALNGVLGFLKWANENDVKFVETERLIYSRKHDYVGKFDIIFTLGREDHKILHIGDYKTASGIYSTTYYQTAGYNGAYIEEFPEKNIGTSWVLRFAKEDKYKDGKLIEEAGTFEVKEISLKDHEKNYEAFLACLAVKRREKELVDASNVIDRIYRITHGLHCCTAKGREALIETLEHEAKIYHGNSENIPKFITFLKSNEN